MPAKTAEWVDVWQMVATNRRLVGNLPLAKIERLDSVLADTEGDCQFSLEFGQHPVLSLPCVKLTIQTRLPLICQRSLRRFEWPVHLIQDLGLLRSEAQIPALAADYEPVLVPANGLLRPADLVGDELLLAIPLVPVDPDSQPVVMDAVPVQELPSVTRPFSALAALKRRSLSPR